MANIALQSEKVLETRALTQRVTREPWTSLRASVGAEHPFLEDFGSALRLRGTWTKVPSHMDREYGVESDGFHRGI